MLKNPNVVIAIRLDRRQRDIALDSLQDGVRATAQLLQGMTQTKLCEAADLDLRHIARIEAAGANSGRGLGAWLKEHGPT